MANVAGLSGNKSLTGGAHYEDGAQRKIFTEWHDLQGDYQVDVSPELIQRFAGLAQDVTSENATERLAQVEQWRKKYGELLIAESLNWLPGDRRYFVSYRIDTLANAAREAILLASE